MRNTRRKKKHRTRRILTGLMACVLCTGVCITPAGAASPTRRISLTSVPSALTELIRRIRTNGLSTNSVASIRPDEAQALQNSTSMSESSETELAPPPDGNTVVAGDIPAVEWATSEPTTDTTAATDAPQGPETSPGVHDVVGSLDQIQSGVTTDRDELAVGADSVPDASHTIPDSEIAADLASSTTGQQTTTSSEDSIHEDLATIVDSLVNSSTETIASEIEKDPQSGPAEQNRPSSGIAQAPSGTDKLQPSRDEVMAAMGFVPNGNGTYVHKDSGICLSEEAAQGLTASLGEEAAPESTVIGRPSAEETATMLSSLWQNVRPVFDANEGRWSLAVPSEPGQQAGEAQASQGNSYHQFEDWLAGEHKNYSAAIAGNSEVHRPTAGASGRDPLFELLMAAQNNVSATAGLGAASLGSDSDGTGDAQQILGTGQPGMPQDVDATTQALLPIMAHEQRMIQSIFKVAFNILEAEETYAVDRHGNPVSVAETTDDDSGAQSGDGAVQAPSSTGGGIKGFTLPDVGTPVTSNAIAQWNAQMPTDPIAADEIEAWEIVPHEGARRLNGRFTFEARGYAIDLEEARESISRWARETFGTDAAVQFASELEESEARSISAKPGVQGRAAAGNGTATRAKTRTLRTGEQATVVQNNGVTGTYEVVVRGDVAQSGKPGVTQLVQIVHATDAPQAAAMTEAQQAAADVNGDGKVSLTDLTQQAGYMVKPHEEGALHPSEPVHQAWESDNLGAHNYINANRWAAPTTSYLIENGDGSVSRVEYVGDTVVVENYGPDLTLQTSRQIPVELEKWGGFYAGKAYNYVIFGQENQQEDKGREVIRIVQYSKDWTRLGSVSLYGANTQNPFLAGSLRCTEAGGYLYVHTCHNMFKNKDGVNHQANMMIEVDQKNLKITDTETEVVWGTGLVSHSFNQFVLVDKDGKLVILDHGDGNTRSLALRRYLTPAGQESFVVGDGQTMEVEAANVQKLVGEVGDNDTGCTLGGFAEVANGYVSAFGYDGKGTRSAPRDVYFAFTNRSLNKTKTTRITKGQNAQAPMLASLGEHGGYLLWEDAADSGSAQPLHFIRYNANGVLGKQATADAHLSDCEPIEVNGRLLWYVTDKSVPVFYELTSSGVTAVSES